MADWKARHKKECAFKKDPNQEQQQQAQAQGDSSRGGAAGTPAVGSSRDGVKTIRLDILNSTDSPKVWCNIAWQAAASLSLAHACACLRIRRRQSPWGVVCCTQVCACGSRHAPDAPVLW